MFWYSLIYPTCRLQIRLRSSTLLSIIFVFRWVYHRVYLSSSQRICHIYGWRANDICPTPCPVEPPKPITDPDALRFEKGESVRKDKLTVDMQKKMQCLSGAVAQACGSLNETSAWRPTAYQAHLYEIYSKKIELKKRSNKKNPAFKPTLDEVDAENGKHGLKNQVGKPGKSRHELGMLLMPIGQKLQMPKWTNWRQVVV